VPQVEKHYLLKLLSQKLHAAPLNLEQAAPALICRGVEVNSFG